MVFLLKESEFDERLLVASHGEPLERVPRGSRPLGRRAGPYAGDAFMLD